jgi:hypothetical protein
VSQGQVENSVGNGLILRPDLIQSNRSHLYKEARICQPVPHLVTTKVHAGGIRDRLQYRYRILKHGEFGQADRIVDTLVGIARPSVMVNLAATSRP